MIKIYTLFCCISLNIFLLDAQDSLSINKCRIYSLKQDTKISTLYQQGKYQQIKSQIEEWIQECGKKEVHNRLLMIESLKKDSLPDNLIDKEFIKNMLLYKAKKDGYFSNDTVFYLPYAYCTDVVNTPKIDLITQETAQNLLVNEQNIEKRILCEFYANANDSVFDDIQQQKLAGTKLQKSYYDFVYQIIKDSLILNIGLLSGAWVPMGEKSTLGPHPLAGFQFGFKNQKNWNLNIAMIARMLKSKNQVSLNFEDTLRTTQDFMGGYFGIDIGKDLKRNINNEMRATIGAGLDGMYFTAPSEEYVYSHNISNWNLNIGAVYRRNIKQQIYVEAQVRYNFIFSETNTSNTTLQSITDLSGNSISIRFSVGFLSGGYIRNAKLRHLQYVY